MIALDGTENKARLGANAILGVSLATAKAAADARGLPLYRYVGGVGADLLPVPMMNILNGGVHADNPIDFQEFMVMPVGAPTFRRGAALRGGDFPRAEERRCTRRGCRPRSATKAALRPTSPRRARRSTSSRKPSSAAGYKPGDDVAPRARSAPRPNSSRTARYVLEGEGKSSVPAEMADYLAELADGYPIASIEDGMAEDDMRRLEGADRQARQHASSWSATICS